MKAERGQQELSLLISEQERQWYPLPPAAALGSDAGSPIVGCSAIPRASSMASPTPAGLCSSCRKSVRNAEISEKCPLTAGRFAQQRLFVWQNQSEQEAEAAGVGGDHHPPPLRLLVGWGDDVGCPGRLPGSWLGAEEGGKHTCRENKNGGLQDSEGCNQDPEDEGRRAPQLRREAEGEEFALEALATSDS